MRTQPYGGGLSLGVRLQSLPTMSPGLGGPALPPVQASAGPCPEAWEAEGIQVPVPSLPRATYVRPLG